MQIVVPILIMAVVVILIVAIKIAEYRADRKRVARGERPLHETDRPIDVIDWTRH